MNFPDETTDRFLKAYIYAVHTFFAVCNFFIDLYKPLCYNKYR
ncbi:hypothetical protein CHK_2924 [Christensenella hongkongensis]|uniref:Uncharacterized protein n=1 Tax=Christensenella hongkongensis TaxID=270498 RepID=A0A0M2NH02_9FIRM|nr:hypothetical protein CHK_2924 [Christensenella hongkongensis]